MKATFVELPPFERHRAAYLSDEDYRQFQESLMRNPTAGDVIQGTGGLRKVRVGDPRRNRGKRGGLRVIYYWQVSESQFWLFTVYDKDEMDDLTADQRKALAKLLDKELEARSAEND
jgi:mRNA-degrading endonuclease RelE of RelBE toxin-antitoxin system